VQSEIERVRRGRNAVIDEFQRLQRTLGQLGPK